MASRKIDKKTNEKDIAKQTITELKTQIKDLSVSIDTMERAVTEAKKQIFLIEEHFRN